MSNVPCEFCGGKTMVVVKLTGPITRKVIYEEDYSDCEEFETYVFCDDCDELEQSSPFVEDYLED